MLRRRLIAAWLAALLVLPFLAAGAVAWHLLDPVHHGAVAHDETVPEAAADLLHGHAHPDGHPAHAHDLATVTAPARERAGGVLVLPPVPTAAPAAAAPRRTGMSAESPSPPGPVLHLLHCVQLT